MAASMSLGHSARKNARRIVRPTSESGALPATRSSSNPTIVFIRSFAVDELPIGISRRSEARRHSYPLRRKMAHHLAERGILPADAGYVVSPQFLEPDYM